MTCGSIRLNPDFQVCGLFENPPTMVFKAALQGLESGWQIYPYSFQFRKSHPVERNKSLS